MLEREENRRRDYAEKNPQVRLKLSPPTMAEVVGANVQRQPDFLRFKQNSHLPTFLEVISHSTASFPKKEFL